MWELAKVPLLTVATQARESSDCPQVGQGLLLVHVIGDSVPAGSVRTPIGGIAGANVIGDAVLTGGASASMLGVMIVEIMRGKKRM